MSDATAIQGVQQKPEGGSLRRLLLLQDLTSLMEDALPLHEFVLGTLVQDEKTTVQVLYCPAVLDGQSQAKPPALVWRKLLSGEGGDNHSAFVEILATPVGDLGKDARFKDLIRSKVYTRAMAQLEEQAGGNGRAPLSRAWSAVRALGVRVAGVLSAVNWRAVGTFGVGVAKFVFVGLVVCLAAAVVIMFFKLADLDARVSNIAARAERAGGVAAVEAAAATRRLAGSDMAILLDLVRQSGVSRFNYGDAFVMFSDPNCPACRSFEQAMQKAHWPFTPLVIPVAFQRGSVDAAAAVLCAKDVAKAWEQAVVGKPANACENGRRQVELNNRGFEQLGLTSTPAFVAMNGSVYQGDLANVLDWAQTNAQGEKLGKRAP